jgi:5-formyltetrahydrofolate cyclo-ligase
MITKKELRTVYKALRQQLTEEEIAQKSVEIANRVLALPIWEKQLYHVFLPISRHHEVNTEYLLHLLAGKDKEVAIPKSDFETRQMAHFLLTDDTNFKINDYGIPEPANGEEIRVIDIDVVFVPLLAFDESGNRIGYGKGFYDNFLAKCNVNTLKIGLSFFEAVAPWEDVFESDVKLDYCVTPHKTYVF